MNNHWIPLALAGSVGLIAILLVVTMYSDLLGARVISKGTRVNVRQGEKVTLALSSSNQIRKLEICTEKKNSVLGRSDFGECQPLHSAVPINQKKADVTIPRNFAPGRAVVITRLRGANGALLPAAPTDEKIALLVKKAKSEENRDNTSACVSEPSYDGPTFAPVWITGTVESVRDICDGHYEIIVTNARAVGSDQYALHMDQRMRIRIQPETEIIEVQTRDNPPRMHALQIRPGNEVGTAYGTYAASELMMIRTEKMGIHR